MIWVKVKSMNGQKRDQCIRLYCGLEVNALLGFLQQMGYDKSLVSLQTAYA